MASLSLGQKPKLKLGFYPYTYARVTVMRSLLLQKEDYAKLLKLSYNELLRFLQDSRYKAEINEFDVSKGGPDAIEMALNKNLMETFQKLKRISEDSLQKAIDAYLLRYDLDNIKAILRSKFTGVDAKDVEPLLYQSVNYSPEYFANLLKLESAEKVVQQIPFLKNADMNDLFAVENALDKFYIDYLFDFASNLAGQGELLQKFLKQEIEIWNIATVLRFKQQKVDKIQNFLVKPSAIVNALVKKESINEMVKFLNNRGLVTLKGDESDLMSKLEVELNSLLFKKKILFSHQHPLTVNTLLGFMFAKEVEVKNLKVLLKGKQLDMDQQFLEPLLVGVA